MFVLLTLIALAFMALIVVSIINRRQEAESMRRLQQRRLKLQVDALTDVINCLEQTIPTPYISKLINDEILSLWQQILMLETGPRQHIESSIRHVQLRTEELMSGRSRGTASYQRDSDAQIAQTQLELNEAGKVLRHICATGRISDEELEKYLQELTWAYLMVSVASFIGQGYKFSAMQDRLSAQSFYQKAQNLLMESLHPDPRRIRMIKELSEVLDGSRSTLSRDLLPQAAN